MSSAWELTDGCHVQQLLLALHLNVLQSLFLHCASRCRRRCGQLLLTQRQWTALRIVAAALMGTSAELLAVVLC
jgi:hypothetical protein